MNNDRVSMSNHDQLGSRFLLRFKNRTTVNRYIKKIGKVLFVSSWVAQFSLPLQIFLEVKRLNSRLPHRHRIITTTIDN